MAIYFNKEHLWVRVEGNTATIGVSDHAQDELGDVLLVETRIVQDKIKQAESFGQIESSKAISDLVSPVSGTIIELNGSLEDEPDRVNDDPYGQGWLVKVTLDDPAELENLLSEPEYNQYLQEEYS